MTVKTIKVDYLARVEGEGAIKVVVRDGAVESAEFRIFEPPRFFEALLRGRAFTEAPDITADLRNLPGRLPDEHGTRHGECARHRRDRAATRSQAAALLWRVD